MGQNNRYLCCHLCFQYSIKSDWVQPKKTEFIIPFPSLFLESNIVVCLSEFHYISPFKTLFAYIQTYRPTDIGID